MELTLTSRDGFTIAATQGPIDESAREPFRQHLHPLVGEKGTQLIIDLSGSPRINSSGLGNLVALTADANTNESRVVLCSAQTFVSMVISITKLDKFFTIAPTLDAAVALCRNVDR
jgi:anti-sigma B factor antagonist